MNYWTTYNEHPPLQTPNRTLLPQTRILLVKLSSFGDVLHALPTLEALRAAYPRAHITWLVEAAYAPLLSGHPALDEVWIAPRLRPAEFFSGSNPARLRRLVQQLRARPFDLVVDVQGLLKSAVWVALARSPRKVGYDKTRELSYLALTERVPPFDPEAHAVWRYLNLAHYLGAPPTLPRFRLGLDAAVDISALIPAEADRPLVVLHPGARWASKLWPPASWARLAEWFHGQGFQVAVTGSAADRELVASITAQCRAPLLNLAGSHLSGPACRHLTKSPVSRHHRHRGHASGRGPGDAGGGPVRPHGPLAHRAFRRRAPGGAPGASVQPLL